MSNSGKESSKGTSKESLAQFSGLRAIFWPIHRQELKKFIPTALVMFCILFNYTVMRDTKDALVVNATGSSAIISFLKLCVTPCAVLFVIIYAKLSSIFDSEKIFYVIVAPFLVFFGLFGFVMFPMADYLHPSKATVDALQIAYPAATNLIDIFANWTYALFYIFSEIWGSAMLTLMFWQYANRIIRKDEAKRFYGLFATIGNAALVLSGPVVVVCSRPENFEWHVSIQLLCGAIVIMGLLCMGVYRWMHTNVLNDKKYYDPVEAGEKRKKEKPGLIESFKIILHSKELGYIALLMLGYGITINLIEVQWKNQLGIYFAGNRGAYNAFMGWQSFYTGLLTILFSWFLGGTILRKCSWKFGALVTPILILSTGLLFFGCIVSQDLMIKIFRGIIVNPVAGSVFIGVTSVVLSKSIKYALFDPTKELAYRPLDETLKTKGKAAVDVIGGRLGKGGGAAIQAIMFSIFVTKDAMLIAPYTTLVFVFICAAWIFAVRGLNRTMVEKAAA